LILPMEPESFLDALPVGVFRIRSDLSGKIILANPEFGAIFGYRESESLEGKCFRDHFLSGSDWKKFIDQVWLDKQIRGLEFQLITSEGSQFWASINASLVENNEGQEQWIAGTIEDIEIRKFGQLQNSAQMEILRQASLSLTSSLELNDVLETIAQCALDLVPRVRNCHIFLYQAGNGKQLEFGTVLWGDGRKNEPYSKPRPDGLTMKVAQSGEPILVSDLRSDPIYAGTPESWTGSIIGLPLKIGKRVVGVMNVSHTEPGALTELNQRLLRMLADQAAIAIENARLYAAVATEKRHLSLLFDIGNELEPSLDSDEILERSIRLTCETMGGALGITLQCASGGIEFGRLKFYRSTRYNHQAIEFSPDIMLREQLFVEIVKKDAAITYRDLTIEYPGGELPGWCGGMHSMLASPIIHGDTRLGILCLFHEQRDFFADDHLGLIQAICQQVGVALSNAGRYEQVEHLVGMLEGEQQRLLDLVQRLPVGVILLDEGFQPVVSNSYADEILANFGIKNPQDTLSNIGKHSIEDLVRMSEIPQPVEIQISSSKPRIFEIVTRPLNGSKGSWILVMREVTQDRQIQSRIHMQDRLATVGQLAAGIAHDFNNIMATILVYSDLLKKDYDLSPQGLEQLGTIQQQVHRAATLIRQIMDFSRQSILEPSSLDLLPFIKEFEKLLGRVLPETIRVELRFRPGDYPVHADPTQLQQVLMNLAINARDAMPNGGVLSFDISHLVLHPGDTPPSPFLPHGEWIAITVGDTGSGIPAEVIPHIYEPFFTTKSIGEGTGLGLAQAYGIIKQHGGYIDVQSEVGEGTRFSIYLPTLPAKKFEKAEISFSPPVEGHGQTILVVEDDPITLNAIQDLLEAQEYQVLAAKNGKSAIKILESRSGTVDLLVSDMVMPEMGGLALFHQVQERWPELETLFVTGHPLGDESQALLEEKKITWLQKPFAVPEFFFKVEELLAAPKKP